jgi:hypothetical protein
MKYTPNQKGQFCILNIFLNIHLFCFVKNYNVNTIFKISFQLNMVVHVCKPATLEAKEGGLQCEVTLKSIRPYVKNQKKKDWGQGSSSKPRPWIQSPVLPPKNLFDKTSFKADRKALNLWMYNLVSGKIFLKFIHQFVSVH